MSQRPRQRPCQSPWTLHEGEALAWLQSLPDDSADALITDPPYSSGGAFRGDRAQGVNAKYEQTGVQAPRLPFAGDAKDQMSFILWSVEYLREARRVVRPGGLCMVFSDWRQGPATATALQMADWVWRGKATWDKGEGARSPGIGWFRHQTEDIYWGTNGPHEKWKGAPVLPGCIEVFPKDLTPEHCDRLEKACLQNGDVGLLGAIARARRNHDDGREAVSRALRAGYPVYRNDAPRL